MEDQIKDSIDIILISSYKELEDNLPDLIPIYQKIYSEEPDFQFWSESTVKEIFIISTSILERSLSVIKIKIL